MVNATKARPMRLRARRPGFWPVVGRCGGDGAMSELTTKTAAMARIRDATDSSGGATFPTFMLSNMKSWEKEGLLELHHGNPSGQIIARITAKGRDLVKKAMTP